MREKVTPEEVESYRQRGFLVLSELLDGDELEEWREAVEEAVDERERASERRIPGRSDSDGDGEPYYDTVFKQRVNLWQTNERVRALMFDERLGRLAADLEGVDGIRIWHDQALIKEPWANPTAFHLDNPYWSFTSAHAISIWTALDDATLENGCLYYVPGSHRARRFENVGIGNDLGALLRVYPEWDEIEPVPCPIPAGGALFHNGLTAHGAGANMTRGRRRAMTCAYMPDGAVFNGIANILRPEQLARLKVGDPLDDDGQNPLIYAR